KGRSAEEGVGEPAEGKRTAQPASGLLFFSPGRRLRAGHDAGNVRILPAILFRVLRPLQLVAGPALFLFLALFLPRTLFGALFESWSGPIRHGSLLKGQ